MIRLHLASSITCKTADLETLLVEIDSSLRVIQILIVLCQAVEATVAATEKRACRIER